MHADPISDLLTRIRNANKAGRPTVEANYSKLTEAVCQILEKEGYIDRARVDRTGQFPQLRITLGGRKPITSIKRVSKPSHRIYRKADEWKPVNQGFGIAIVTTPKGVMTAEEARSHNLGGEHICEVY